MSSRYAILLDELHERLVVTRSDMQHVIAGHHVAAAPAMDCSRAQRRQTDQQVRELLRLVRQAAKRHRGWLVARTLRSPRGQTICELLYAVNGDGDVDRGVRFQIDHETDMLGVWWLPMIEPGADDSPNVEIVVVGGFYPETVFTATISHIDFPATVTLIVQELISVKPGWHIGDRPVLAPLPKLPESLMANDHGPIDVGSGGGTFTSFRRNLWKRA